MNISKTFLLNNAKAIAFDEEEHEYYDKDGSFTSVSKVISWYTKPFDAKNISSAMAKRDGVTQKSVLKSWDDKKNVALDRGNSIHNALELYFNGDFDELNLQDELFSNVAKFVCDTEDNFLTEQIIFNKKHRLSGTIDLMRFNSDGTVSLFDYKTNKEITTNSKYGNKLLDGLSHLDDCHLNKYSLQLGLYKWMLEADGYKVRDMHLIHINHDGVVKMIECKDLSKEINEVIMREDEEK